VRLIAIGNVVMIWMVVGMARPAGASPLQERVRAIANQSRGLVSVSYIDLQTDAHWGINENAVVRAASIIKVPLLIELHRQMHAGRIRPNRRVLVTLNNKVGGTGVLHGRKPPYRLALTRLTDIMITRSDNTATNVIIDLVSMRAVNRQMRRMGFPKTRLQRKMVHKPPPENYTTARETALLLAQIARDKTAAPVGHLTPFRLLSKARKGDKLGALLPAGVAIARKGGRLYRHMHDAAIIGPPGNHVVIVVLISRFKSKRRAKAALNQIGLAVYQDLENRRTNPSH
jgi:beta-lactamase class A